MFTVTSTTSKNTTPGYTSNCTDEDKRNGIDFVFIIGKDNPGETVNTEIYMSIKADCEAKGLKYVILGDGKVGANLDEIANLPNVRNVVVYGHGSADQKNHMISLTEGKLSNSMDTIQTIQAQTQCKNFFVCSCFGGKIVDDFKNNTASKLQEGTCLSAYSAPDEESWTVDAASIFSILINKTTPGNIAPTISLMADLVKIIPQTMVLAYQLENDLASQTIMRNTRKVYLGVKEFCEYQLSEINRFINTILLLDNTDNLKYRLANEFPDLNLDEYIQLIKNHEDVNLLRLQMSTDEISEFQDRSLFNHIHHNDVEVLNALITQTPSLMFSLSKEKPEHTSKVMRQLLKHRNTLSEQDRAQIDRVMSQLRRFDLTRTDLSNVKLQGVNLIEANLSRADFTGADLKDANLTGANLMNANFTGADLKGADLTGANLSIAKGLTASMLVSAKSLKDIKLYVKQIKAMSYEERKLLKNKIMHDYISFINSSNDISLLINTLNAIIEDKEHPLKFERIRLEDYGETDSYKEIIKAGSDKLITLLNTQKPHFYEFTEDTLSQLTKITKTVNLFEASYIPTFLKSAEKSLAEKLIDATPKRPEIANVDDAKVIFQGVTDYDTLTQYAKRVIKETNDVNLLIRITQILPPHIKSFYATNIISKITNSKELMMLIQRLAENDKLNYAKDKIDIIKNRDDLLSIIRLLPEKDQLDYVSYAVSQLERMDDLSWLMSHLKQSQEVVTFLQKEIDRRKPLTQMIAQSTPKFFKESAPGVDTGKNINQPTPDQDLVKSKPIINDTIFTSNVVKSKPANDPVIPPDNENPSRKINPKSSR